MGTQGPLMPGSMDDNPPVVLGRGDYEYYILRRDQADVRISAGATMSLPQIARELRDIANFVEQAGQ